MGVWFDSEDRADVPIDATIYRTGGSNCRTATLMPGQATPWVNAFLDIDKALIVS